MKGVSNPADMMTKAVNKEKMHKYMGMISQKIAEGRAEESLKIKRSDNDRQVGSKVKSRLATKCVSSKEECKALGVS